MRVLQTCQIYFTDVGKAVYFGGDNVSGTVCFSLVKQKKLTDLTLNAKGETRCSWTERESRGSGKNRETKTVRYSSLEVHFRTITSLLVGYEKGDGGEVILQPGKHTFAFSFILPPNAPTSLERPWGRVRYTIKITAVRSWKLDDTFRMPFSVISKYDLNTNPSCGVPVTRRIQKSFNVLFVSKGAMIVIVTLPATGFVPGQDVMMHCEIRNPSKVKVREVKFSLYQRTTFTCTYPRRKTKVDLNKIVEYAGIGADKGKDVNYPVNFKIPALPPSTILQHLITGEYFLKVKAFCDGMHTNPSELIPITIGTIPLHSSLRRYHNTPRPVDYSAPSTSVTLDYNPVPPSAPSAPSAPQEPSEPPPYWQVALPTYEESQLSQQMSEADPEDKGSTIVFSPVYPVYNFPPPMY